MKTELDLIQLLQVIHSTIISAVSELDLRGTDKNITKAMCIVDATFNSAINGEFLSSTEALKRGLLISKQ